jgi:ATP-dependent Clp protease ATP-binding subunit ClpA
MVDLVLPRQLHAVGQRAIDEAVARRAGVVESEHVLLAILSRPDEPAAKLLTVAGVTHASFASALDAERKRSLAAAGVAARSNDSLTATPRTSPPSWGASIRDVLRNADKPAAKNGRPGALEIELAVAILSTELGTVPRALAIARIDRSDVLAALAN